MRTILYFLILFLLVFVQTAHGETQQRLGADTIKVGPATNADKKIILDLNNGASNPALRGNDTTGKLQFSHDGVSWSDVGSGSGGGDILDLAENGDAEAGTAGFTNAGSGTYNVTTTSANVGQKLQSFRWNAAANNDTLTSTAYTIPTSLENGACSASFIYKGGDTNIKAQVLDNGNAVIVEQTLAARTTYNHPAAPTFLSFPCSNGSVKLRLIASADAAEIFFDLFKIGSLGLINVSQSEVYGTFIVHDATNCNWSISQADFTSDFPADTDCAAPNVTGKLTAPATKVPHAVADNAPPGKYFVSAIFRLQGATNVDLACRLVDATGTEISRHGTEGGNYDGGASGIRAPMKLEGSITYSTAGNRVFKVQCAGGGGGSAAIVNDEEGSFQINVLRFPDNTEQAVKIGAEHWRIDANIGGANIDLGAADQAGYITANNAGLTLTQNPGSNSVGISCSSTNDNSVGATTCSAGNEEPGIVFDIPRAGNIEVCFGFSHLAQTGAGGDINVAFQAIHTANGSQVVTAGNEGKGRINSRNSIASSTLHFPYTVCGSFVFASPGKKTVRLMYEQDNTATVTSNAIVADQASTIGDRDIHVTAKYVDQNHPPLILPNTVISTYTGTPRIEWAVVDISCTSSPCTIDAQSGGISQITRASIGNYTATFSPAFAVTPSCTVTPIFGTGEAVFCQAVSKPTTSSLNFLTRDGSGAADDRGFMIQCIGPK